MSNDSVRNRDLGVAILESNGQKILVKYIRADFGCHYRFLTDNEEGTRHLFENVTCIKTQFNLLIHSFKIKWTIMKVMVIATKPDYIA